VAPAPSAARDDTSETSTDSTDGSVGGCSREAARRPEPLAQAHDDVVQRSPQGPGNSESGLNAYGGAEGFGTPAARERLRCGAPTPAKLSRSDPGRRGIAEQSWLRSSPTAAASSAVRGPNPRAGAVSTSSPPRLPPAAPSRHPPGQCPACVLGLKNCCTCAPLAGAGRRDDGAESQPLFDLAATDEPPPTRRGAGRSNRRRRGPPQRRWCSFYLRMGDVKDFDLVPMIIGRQGRNTRKIADETGTKVRVRGKGSGHREVTTNEEAPTPLMLVVAAESDNSDGFYQAVGMANRLLRSMEARYRRHCAAKGVAPTSLPYALGPMSDSSYWELQRNLPGNELPQRICDEGELDMTSLRVQAS